MIKCINHEIEIHGSRPEIVSETCCILQSIKNALIKTYGNEEAERDMQFIFDFYDKAEDELAEQMVKDILAMLGGKSNGR